MQYGTLQYVMVQDRTVLNINFFILNLVGRDRFFKILKLTRKKWPKYVVCRGPSSDL